MAEKSFATEQEARPRPRTRATIFALLTLLNFPKGCQIPPFLGTSGQQHGKKKSLANILRLYEVLQHSLRRDCTEVEIVPQQCRQFDPSWV